MISLEDYLAVRDWKTIPPVFGEHGEYRWVRLGRSLWPKIYFDQLTPPQKPFKILSLGFLDDWNRLEQEAYNPDGSIRDAEESLTPLTDSFKDIYINGGTMILDRVLEWSHIEPQASLLEPSYFLGDTAQSTQFWAAITQLEPYFYLFGEGECIFIAREQTLLDEFMACSAVNGLDDFHREMAAETRLIHWQRAMADAGPEKCVVHGCDELRVKLAVKCYGHHYLSNFERLDF